MRDQASPIALGSNAAMMKHAEATNARLRDAVDATHRPHITMLQRFVQTAALNMVYAGVGVPWRRRSRQDGP